MSNLVDHARRELAAIGESDAEFSNTVVKMVEAFSAYGHSGGSASVMTAIVTELLQHQNLTPLTDDPAEWFFHGSEMSPPDGVWQNIRNGEAFSHDGGKTYYLISENGNEDSFRSGEARMHVSRSHARLRLVQEAKD